MADTASPEKKMRAPMETWGCSSAGRAPALQAGGHGFESHHLHQGTEGFLKKEPFGSLIRRDSKNERNRGTVRWTVTTASDQGAQFAPRPNPIISTPNRKDPEGNFL